jgi:hypothetical protein
MKKIIISLVFIFTASVIFTSCKKDYLETVPTDAVSAGAATLTTDNAWAALNGIHRALYVRYGSQGRGGIGAYYLHNDEYGEDMVFNYATWTYHVRWQSRETDNAYNGANYLMFYGWIANANILINGVGENTAGDQEDKDAIVGQALLYRAWCHYHLVQDYGKRYVPGGGNTQLGVPYMLDNSTEGKARNTVEEVYTMINADIDRAIPLLEGKTMKNKSHLNIDVANGLKSRVALTMGEWATAVTYADKVIANHTLMDFATYAQGFRMNSESESEFIWASQIQEDQTDKWANYGAYVSRNFSSSSIRKNPRSINSKLYDMISPTDVRKTLWDPSGQHLDLIASGVDLVSSAKRYPYTNQKFIAVSTADSRVDVPHMRVSEMYLNKAEALAHQGLDAEAAQTLYDFAVVRDPSYTLSTNTGQALLDEIYVQRRIELWGEGFRWYDLKRLNLPLDRTGANHSSSITNGVLQVAAGDPMWQWDIPRDELNANPNMVQN